MERDIHTAITDRYLNIYYDRWIIRLFLADVKRRNGLLFGEVA